MNNNNLLDLLKNKFITSYGPSNPQCSHCDTITNCGTETCIWLIERKEKDLKNKRNYLKKLGNTDLFD